MTWKYVNPGYGELFNNTQLQTQYSTDVNPDNGVYIHDFSGSKVHRFPTTRELWIKCGFYYDDTWSGGCIGIGTWNTDKKLTGLYCFNYLTNTQLLINDTVCAESSTLRFIKCAYNDIVVHIKSDRTDGILEVIVNHKPWLLYSGNVNDGNNMDNLYLYSGRSNYNLFDIIVADEDISQERVCVCTLNNLTGTWDGISDGLAKATDVNQTLSQQIDTAKLTQVMSKHSSEPTITSVAIAAIGVRYDSTKVNSLKASVLSASSEVFSDINYIATNNSMPTTTYIKNISIDTLKNVTLNLVSVKQ